MPMVQDKHLLRSSGSIFSSLFSFLVYEFQIEPGKHKTRDESHKSKLCKHKHLKWERVMIFVKQKPGPKKLNDMNKKTTDYK